MSEPQSEREPAVERLESFSDAVFAIAITLLALELVVPHLTAPVSAGRLSQALEHVWPRFLSFALSFVLIGLIWVNYQRMMSYIHRTDQALVWFNLLLLLNVSALSFTAALLGEYALTPGAQTVAALIYGGWLTVGGVFFNGIWWRAVVADLLVPGLDRRHVRRLGLFWSLGPALYLVLTLFALLDTWISVIGFVALAIVYVLPAPRIRRTEDDEA